MSGPVSEASQTQTQTKVDRVDRRHTPHAASNARSSPACEPWLAGSPPPPSPAAIRPAAGPPDAHPAPQPTRPPTAAHLPHQALGVPSDRPCHEPHGLSHSAANADPRDPQIAHLQARASPCAVLRLGVSIALLVVEARASQRPRGPPSSTGSRPTATPPGSTPRIPSSPQPPAPIASHPPSQGSQLARGSSHRLRLGSQAIKQWTPPAER